MKPQARPFTVETKSKRRPRPSQAGWAMIDEPAPADLPVRDIREDAPDTPFAAASRVFSSFATSAITSASTLSDLAASVFTPKAQEEPADAPATDESRTRRILPSLLPLNPFEVAVEEDGPLRKEVKAKRPRKRAVPVTEQREVPEPTMVAGDPAIAPTIGPELSPTATPSPRKTGKPNRRRAEARVRAGEGWKRRRLPKACW
jgi:hypothetical protein